MAGSLTEKDVDNIPRCPNHDIACVIKTGTKQNATFGKSFYICNNLTERCLFAVPANIAQTECHIHNEMVELKSFILKSDGIRCYFRCVYGKSTGGKWCGNIKVPNKKTDEPKDITIISGLTEQPIDESLSKDKDSFKKEEEEMGPNVDALPTSESNRKQDRNPEQTRNDDSLLKDRHLPDSFYALRPSRISDVSEANSHDSSVSSTCSNNESVNSVRHKKNVHVEVISSDEENEGARIVASNPEIVKNQSEKSNNIASLELQLKSQEVLLKRYGSLTADNGKKIQDKIDQLVQSIKDLKMKEAKEARNAVQSKLVFPSMTSNEPQIHGAFGHKDYIRTTKMIEFNELPPYHPAAQGALRNERNVPVFGGRMTEKRLKEVGRMTKEAIEHLHNSLDTRPAPTQESEDPEHLNVPLMTHQRQALAWLTWRETQTPSGGILADDMGLGKTLTMISLVLKSKQQSLTRIKELPKESKLLFSKATLIICPASLVHQWHKEIEKRVKKLQLRVHLYHGSNRETRPNRLMNYDIVLTTYNIVSIEGKPFVEEEKEKASKPALGEWLDVTQPKKSEPGPIFKLFWRRIILDEGHTIKNYRTNVSVATCSLDAESRWIVTGTPIQNNTMDLYSLVKFLRVSPFDELKFWKHEVDNKTASGRKRMNSIVTSILLRRTKDQMDAKTGKPLVVLPKRSTVLHRLKLSKSENEVYSLMQMFSKNMFTEFLSTRKDGVSTTTRPAKGSKEPEMPTEVLGMNVNDAIKMFGLGSVSASNAGCLLVLVLRLRQCCSHMSLMCEVIDKELCKSEGIDVPLEEQLGNMSIDERNFNTQDKRAPELEEKFPSTKIKKLLEKLRELQIESQGKKPIKSVIVSQWTRMLDIVAYHLRRNGMKYEAITGSVNAKKRADIVEDFNSDGGPQVMLVSLKAGGVGLNLIGGSHLFLLDQHWNPSLEDQACDRIYRVGQQNNVVIHRFLCEETVEERIVKLQERKKELAKTVLYGGKMQKLTLDDLKLIFGFNR